MPRVEGGDVMAERVDDASDDEVLSPAHDLLVRQLAREMVRNESDAEERAALTDDARRLIPWRLVKMAGHIPRMTAQFEAYLLALPLQHPLLTRLKAEQPDLYAQYAAYLGLRRNNQLSARGAQWVLAKEWRVSYSTVRRRIAETETHVVGYVRVRLAEEIRRRREEAAAMDVPIPGPRMDD